MNAVIDIGNTKTKIGLFRVENTLEVFILSTHNIVNFLIKHKVINALLCNVSTQNTLVKDLLKLIPHVTVCTVETPMPIITSYATPTSLGVDRLAACVGARNYRQGNVLVIDAGSCITYDIVTDANEHIGGLITPGIHMRLKAMHTFTANLPLVPFETTPIIGNTTEKCLQSGAVNGTLTEMKGLIMRFQEKYKDLSIIIGGGDAVFFDKNLKLNTFVVSNLAVEGLHTIFKYNEYV